MHVPVLQVNVTSGSGSTTSSRPMGASATSTISQSVLLSGTAGGQGQMYLRVSLIRWFICGSSVLCILMSLMSFCPAGEPLP